MNLSYDRARAMGLGAIGAVLAVQAFNGFVCYRQDVVSFLWTTVVCVGLPMLPAVFSLWHRNPLRAVGASALFVPWLLLAYYEDCIVSDGGGGASMTYLAVQVYGLFSALIGAAITGPITRRLGVEIRARN